MKYTRLKQYFLDGMPAYIEDIIPNQINQAWIRIASCLIIVIYVVVHIADLSPYSSLLVLVIISYIGLQFYTLRSIKRHPLSFTRMMFMPVLDVIFLSFVLWLDGGQLSPLYLFYFVVMMGNGMRFGNHVLIYSQVLVLISFSSTCMYVLIAQKIPLDIPVFVLQMLSLMVLPRYTQRVNTHAHNAVNAKKDAESIAFQLLDKSPVAAFTFQYNDKKDICINYVNQSLQDISPLPVEELIGYPIRSLFSSEDIDEVEHACELILEDEMQRPTFYIRTQGKERTLQLLGNIRSFYFNHALIGICFLTDITKQQQATLKMQQNMQEGYMSTLVAGIVHNFRNVLTSIMGTAEMMQFTQKDSKTLKNLELIIQASEQGSRMVTNLLTLGKASQSESKEKKHDMLQALRSIVNLLRIQLPKSIPLRLHAPETLPPVNVGLTQMEQVLMNLIKNASEASPKGGAIDVDICIGMQKSPSNINKPALLITVRDHGVGIPEEHLHQVTKAFWTSRKDSGGTGLGLAMVQRVVRQHNGSFHIDSVVHQGTSITISFPLVDQQSSPEAVMLENKKSPEPLMKVDKSSQQAWKILLVDDNADVIQVHQQMLERMGHDVYLAYDGKEALACFQKFPHDFNLIVTDFIMPIMDGMVLCQHIREKNMSIPLLMITAFGENHKLQKSSELNVQMLSKPVSFQEFEQTLAMIQNIACQK